jgi:GTPase SAR1 family protein
MVLVGNKCDLEAQREVTFEQGKSLANEYGIKFFEASAKDSTNVSEIFMELTLQCFACLPSSSSSEEESVEHIHPILHLKPTCFCN